MSSDRSRGPDVTRPLVSFVVAALLVSWTALAMIDARAVSPASLLADGSSMALTAALVALLLRAAARPGRHSVPARRTSAHSSGHRRPPQRRS